jgi:cytochrome P450
MTDAGVSAGSGTAPDIEAVARDVLTQAVGVDPYALYRQLREHAPVIAVGAFTLVSRYADCRAILRDRNFLTVDEEFRDRVMPWWRRSPGLRLATGSLVFSNPPGHDRVRPVIAGAFTRRRVHAMRSMIRDRVTEVVDRLDELGRDGREVDFVSEFANEVPIRVVADLLGIPEADRDWFVPLAGELSAALDPFWSRGQLAAADRAAQELAPYCRRLADRVAGSSGNGGNTTGEDGGVLADLVAMHRADPEALDIDGLIRNIALLLVASYETTSALLCSGLQLLCRHPRLRERLRGDPGLAADYVEEMLRYDVPTHIAARWSRVDTVIGGVPVPAYSIVLCLLGAGNRDPDEFPDPDVFAPGRPDCQPLAFGSGAHLCVGAWLARLEAQEVFTQLSQRLPDITPTGEPVFRDRRWIRSYGRMPVVVHPG